MSDLMVKFSSFINFWLQSELHFHYSIAFFNNRPFLYSAQTITNVDYADDIALLANTPAQAQTLIHSLEWAAVGIGLHVNVHKTEYMCFN